MANHDDGAEGELLEKLLQTRAARLHSQGREKRLEAESNEKMGGDGNFEAPKGPGNGSRITF